MAAAAAAGAGGAGGASSIGFGNIRVHGCTSTASWQEFQNVELLFVDAGLTGPLPRLCAGSGLAVARRLHLPPRNSSQCLLDQAIAYQGSLFKGVYNPL